MVAPMSIELIEQKLAEIERRLAAVESKSVASPQPSAGESCLAGVDRVGKG